MDSTTPPQTTAISGQQSPAVRLATVMREARRFALDIRRVAETMSGCGDHQRLTRHHQLAEERKVLDPDYVDTLRSIISSLDRRIARHAPAPELAEAALDGPTPRDAGTSDVVATLVGLRARAVDQLGAIEDVLDDVMAEHAIAELRFFPCFSTAPASISAATFADGGILGTLFAKTKS